MASADSWCSVGELDVPSLNLIVHVARFIARGDWLDVSGLAGEPRLMKWDSPYVLRKLTVKYSRVVAGDPAQDYAMTTHHFLNLTDDAPDSSWTSGDYAAVESLMDAFWNAIKPRYSPSVILAEYSWRADGPAYRPHTPKPSGLLSPTLRATARALPGTSASTEMMPPQVAVTVTEVTSAKYTVEDVEGSGAQVRNRWGRFYLPAPASVNVIGGRLAAAGLQTDVANAAQTFYNGCVAADFIPVVYSPTTGSSWSCDEIHVDDIFDVVRSRRFITPKDRKVKAITAP